MRAEPGVYSVIVPEPMVVVVVVTAVCANAAGLAAAMTRAISVLFIVVFFGVYKGEPSLHLRIAAAKKHGGIAVPYWGVGQCPYHLPDAGGLP